MPNNIYVINEIVTTWLQRQGTTMNPKARDPPLLSIKAKPTGVVGQRGGNVNNDIVKAGYLTM